MNPSKHELSEEDQVLLMIRGAIATMPQDQQDSVKQAYLKILEVEKEFGDNAIIAISWRGAELAK